MQPKSKISCSICEYDHVCNNHWLSLPKKWPLYCGSDCGGGEENLSKAIGWKDKAKLWKLPSYSRSRNHVILRMRQKYDANWRYGTKKHLWGIDDKANLQSKGKGFLSWLKGQNIGTCGAQLEECLKLSLLYPKASVCEKGLTATLNGWKIGWTPHIKL